tara:strand:+ start:1048 stop:1341 length:294 start_codon:yes stop_codon:yes gene_type:complete
MPKDQSIDINYVADLARLKLSDEEKETMSNQLNDILGHFEQLNAVDVSGIEPMAHALKVHNVWREGDEAGPVFSPSVVNQLAPESRDNQVVVPKVVE